MGALKRWIVAHPLWAFFIIAFVLTWLAVLPLVLSRRGGGVSSSDLPVAPFQILGALAGPTLGALIVTAVTSGGAGVRRLLARCIQWRVGIGWYLLLFFGPPVILTLGAMLFLGLSILSAFVRNLPLLFAFYLPTLLAGIIFGPLWEEPGWRGFALPRLQAGHGPLLGTLILGLLWGLWHLPGFFGGWLPLTISGFLAVMVGAVAGSFVFTWMYNHTRGSVLMMILLHSALNAASAMGGRILPTEMSEPVRALVYSGWIPAVTYTIVALLLIVSTRGTLGYKPAQAS